MFTSVQTSVARLTDGLVDFCGTGVILFVATVACNWTVAALFRRLVGRDPSMDVIAVCSCTLFMLAGLLSGSFAVFVAGAAHAVLYWTIRHQRLQILAPRSEQL